VTLGEYAPANRENRQEEEATANPFQTLWHNHRHSSSNPPGQMLG